ncbi:hypothetical protein FB451DRAFT_1388141 [Mycena latifolia]|nr:hypothetical protein FB451DRAFT_1388141 [Mycena latifolia]
MLLAKLARHKSTAEAMDLEPCEGLVTILELSDRWTVGAALRALASIAIWPAGAEAAVAAKVLEHIPANLASGWTYLRRSACSLVAALAQHKATAAAVARAVPRGQLIILLRDEYGPVRKSADKALQVLEYLTNPQAPTHKSD